MDACKLIRFCGLVVELHMHTNVHARYACGCSLSVTCLAMLTVVNIIYIPVGFVAWLKWFDCRASRILTSRICCLEFKP